MEDLVVGQNRIYIMNLFLKNLAIRKPVISLYIVKKNLNILRIEMYFLKKY